MSTGPGTPLSVELTRAGPRLSNTPPRRPDCPDVVLIEPTLVGVCRSDLKEIDGQRPGPSQFGHELVGLVAESSTPALPVGARVCLDPNVPLRRGTGFARAMWAGGEADRLVRAFPQVPANASARRLVFAEPMACAAHCLTMARSHLGGQELRDAAVCVVGAGVAGMLIARAAGSKGAQVRLVNRDADRLEFLSARGVVPGMVTSGPAEAPESGHDVVVIATTFVLPELLEQALRLVRRDGLVMLYGGTKAGDRLAGLDCDLDTVRRGELARSGGWRGKPVLVGGSYGTSANDFQWALRALSDTRDGLGVERTVVAEVSLSELPGTLRRLASTRQLGKVLVRP